MGCLASNGSVACFKRPLERKMPLVSMNGVNGQSGLLDGKVPFARRDLISWENEAD